MTVRGNPPGNAGARSQPRANKEVTHMSEKKLTKEQLLEICESMTDKPEDLLKTCGMLMRLPPEIRQEIYYMIKGAALVAHSR